MRSGVVTRKLGMSVFFDTQGRRLPVTLLKLDDCQVVGLRDEEKDGVVAVRVGYGNVKANKIAKPLKGYFLKSKVDFKRGIVDFKVSQNALLEVGSYINADHYVIGQFIDVTGISVGKGFAGVMKRYGFGGLRASHGVSVSHRSHGSTGHCQDPGKVFKGKKMAGHMGSNQVTVSNLEIIDIDKEHNILVIKGAVPGATNSIVIVKDAKKKGLPPNIPYPGVTAIERKDIKGEAASSDDVSGTVVANSKEDQSAEHVSDEGDNTSTEVHDVKQSIQEKEVNVSSQAKNTKGKTEDK